MTSKSLISLNSFICITALLGLVTGLYIPVLYPVANITSLVVMNLLKLLSIPLIFFSVVATISGMQSIDAMRRLGQRVIKYTISTTLIAASIALGLFLLIDPTQHSLAHKTCGNAVEPFESYSSVVCKMIPSNVVKTFSEGNVVGVMLIALSLSFAILTLPTENKKMLHSFFASIFAALLSITRALVYLIPIGVWAFVTLFVKHILLEDPGTLASLGLYFVCIMGANAIQGFVVLPLFLYMRGLSPIKTIKGMLPALTIAFFSRSSNTALPTTIQCSEDNLGVDPTISRFTLPLCSTINMNGCAAFIVTTVLFVGQSNGMVFSPLDMIVWVFIATIAAIGNAGVPMGCYFLAGSLITTMNVPLHIFGVILPLYAIVDMFETALNVWSDACIAAMVNKEEA